MKSVFLDFDTLGPKDIDISQLTEQLPDLQLFPNTSHGELTERISDARVVIVNKVKLDETTLRAADKLKLICLAATGTDNVCLAAAAERKIAVCNIRNYCTPSVIQHVFSLILGLTHHLREYEDLIRGKVWSDRPEFCLLDFPIRELNGKILGIVGLGSLGKGVAQVARAFGMTILAARRPYDQTNFKSEIREPGIERVSLNNLLERSHIVSLHCPLNDETEHLINRKTLATMRRDAILINTARGSLIDSQALVDALKNGEITGAGIDVLRQEPPVDPEPIVDVQLPNLIVTPHIAWAAQESRQRAVDEIVANITAFFDGTKRNRVV